MPDPVGRHLKTILEECDAPARQNHDPQRRILVLEMPIPGKGHEDVGDGEQ